MHTRYKKQVLFVMGVSGSGKSTIGSMLATQLSIPFFDGDDFHPTANKEKMAAGIPLEDEDRMEWLNRLNQLAKDEYQKKGCVIACSALKEIYRTLLKKEIEHSVQWIFLNGSYDTILARVNQRKDHFMPPDLLQSQFDILEIPEGAKSIDIQWKPDRIANYLNEELQKSEFGLIGLGVMGKSLARNLGSKGFYISVYNRHVEGKEENVAVDFKKQFPEMENAEAFDKLDQFVDSLQSPRKIMLMVNAGKAVDMVIKQLLPFLKEGDIIIDGGNSHYNKTQKRNADLFNHAKVHFIGAGISGGEEGALTGPSIMPGGNIDAYKQIQCYLETIAARDLENKPCCNYIGKDGSGHFVKMVHNGIEYSEMQLIAEVYSILRKGLKKDPDEIADILENWTKGYLNSYLLEITVKILRKKEANNWLIDKILDKAGNKGTGNWTTIAAAELGIPISMLTSALFSRYISSFKELRVKAAALYKESEKLLSITPDMLEEAYHTARIVNHHQGISLLAEASKTYNWELNLSEICRIWTNGCIIRSHLMNKLILLLKEEKELLLHSEIALKIKAHKNSLASVVAESTMAAIPLSCFSAAINYFNAYIEQGSNACIIQAQRDFFGAHKYQRNDIKNSEFVHTQWE